MKFECITSDQSTLSVAVIWYVLPNDDFAKQFAVVYNDWDVEGLNGKRNMRPCNSMMSN